MIERSHARIRRVTSIVASAILLANGAPASGDPVDLKPFRATYVVKWKGITAGTAVLELKSDAPGIWSYVNVNTPRGIFRLALPDSITLADTFELHDGHVRPLSYRGTDEKERGIELNFNWIAKRVVGSAKGKKVDLELPEGTQDPMSLQIASLRGLASGELSDVVRMIDTDELKEYALTQETVVQIDTRLGKLEARVYSSKARTGDRITRTWVAPALGYLPVRAERLRGTRLEFTLEIESVIR